MIAIVPPRKSRALDWACGLFALAFGIVLALPGESLPWPSEGLLRGLPEFAWAAGFGLVGIARVVALVINGRMPSGSPAIRAASALVSAYLWSQFLATAAQASVAFGRFLPTLAFSAFFVVAEGYLSVRATREFMAAGRRNGKSR